MGGDTPDALRDYFKTSMQTQPGAPSLSRSRTGATLCRSSPHPCPIAENTPDVTEIGNTWSPTFTTVGAFSDITDLMPDLGGDNLLPSLRRGRRRGWRQLRRCRTTSVRATSSTARTSGRPPGSKCRRRSRSSTTAVAQLKTDAQSGFYLGGEDWRNGISWIFAYGGDLAKKDGDTWKSTLSDPKTIEGLEALQAVYQSASLAPVTEADSTPWVNINNNEATGAPEAATIIAPGWAHWSIGDLAPDPADSTKTIATWNPDVFGVFVLPGVDGGNAPVFAGGSNIAISAASPNQAALA